MLVVVYCCCVLGVIVYVFSHVLAGIYYVGLV